MGLTPIQINILRTLAANRVKSAGSYVAGGVALNHKIAEPRQSRDIDIFHDTVDAMLESWRLDRASLEQAGYTVEPIRELKTFIEARISRDGEVTEIQWGTDSAYRFFPLVEDPLVGYTLHPMDLVANKLGALVGRTGNPFIGAPETLPAAMEAGDVVFHEGRICGAWPMIIEKQ